MKHLTLDNLIGAIYVIFGGLIVLMIVSLITVPLTGYWPSWMVLVRADSTYVTTCSQAEAPFYDFHQIAHTEDTVTFQVNTDKPSQKTITLTHGQALWIDACEIGKVWVGGDSVRISRRYGTQILLPGRMRAEFTAY